MAYIILGISILAFCISLAALGISLKARKVSE